MIIGDTPAQIGQIEAADAMMIDGKIVTRDDYRALNAQVEAFYSALMDAENISKASKEMISGIYLCMDKTPQQHLAEIRAQAGRDGFIAGYMLCNDGSPLLKHNYKGMADKYADSIRQESVK